MQSYSVAQVFHLIKTLIYCKPIVDCVFSSTLIINISTTFSEDVHLTDGASICRVYYVQIGQQMHPIQFIHHILISIPQKNIQLQYIINYSNCIEFEILFVVTTTNWLYQFVIVQNQPLLQASIASFVLVVIVVLSNM